MAVQQQGQVTFQFRAETVLGTEIRITGNIESLGLWDVLQSAPLTTSEKTYPIWSTPAPISLPVGAEVQYKYIYKRNGEVEWEPQDNRVLLVEHSNTIVEDEENTPISRHILIQNEVPSFLSPSYESTSFKINENIKFTGEESLIIVSMNLPLMVSRNEAGKWSVYPYNGLWIPSLFEIAQTENINFKWIGWPHILTEDEAEQKEIAAVLEPHNCIPLFIPPDTFEKNFKFCTGIIFPIFNNIIDTAPETIPQYSNELWEAYKQVNSKFADKIMEHYRGEMIWVHDYQLLLTPSFVSRRTHEVYNIGLYLHSPFPSSEIYRVLPHREALLHGILCCDLIGFHLFEYARHFLASCKRLLGLDHEFSKGGYLSLNYYGRYIMVRIGHLGVEPKILEASVKSEKFRKRVKALENQHEGKKVIIGIDQGHRLSGLILKLHAFRLALRELDLKIIKPVLVQVITKAMTESKETLEEILSEQEDINAEFGDRVVEIMQGDFSKEERYAFMAVSHGVINSSLREGLCLIPFEYLLVNKDRPTNIILSEFAGVSRALSSPKRVNPFDIQKLKDDICIMITSNAKNSPNRLRDINYVTTSTTFKWALNFLTDLKRAQKDTQNFQFDTNGFGDKLKLIALRKNFKFLKAEAVLRAYKESRNRAFFFDNEGTLYNLLKQSGDKPSGPSDRILQSLQDLSSDERNAVFVITGRERKKLETWFAGVKGLGMAAEYGSFLKWGHKSQWQLPPQTISLWMETAKQIISAYVTRTEGAFMTEKECSVVFQYRNTDPDLGVWQAKELTSHLEILLKPFLNECEVSNGLGYVEVKPRGINKGTTVYKVIEQLYQRRGPVDFILTIGDDVSDEEMFRVVSAMKAEQSPLLAHRSLLKTFTCTVGRKPSRADYYVNDANEVIQNLEQLRGWNKRNLSYGDLKNLKSDYRDIDSDHDSNLNEEDLMANLLASP